MNDKLTEGQVLEQASQARFLLEHPMFTKAFEDVHDAIVKQIEDCPLADVRTAEDLRKCLRLLRDVKANIVLRAERGKVVSFNLEQERSRAEKLKKFLTPNYFR